MRWRPPSPAPRNIFYPRQPTALRRRIPWRLMQGFLPSLKLRDIDTRCRQRRCRKTREAREPIELQRPIEGSRFGNLAPISRGFSGATGPPAAGAEIRIHQLDVWIEASTYTTASRRAVVADNSLWVLEIE